MVQARGHHAESKRGVVDRHAATGTEAISRSGKGSARRTVRARILLKSDIGETDQEIAEALMVGVATVERIRRKFAAGGMEAAIESVRSRRVRQSGGWTARAKPSW